jgi:hypothetical protein
MSPIWNVNVNTYAGLGGRGLGLEEIVETETSSRKHISSPP